MTPEQRDARLNAANRITAVLETLSDEDRRVVLRAMATTFHVAVPKTWRENRRHMMKTMPLTLLALLALLGVAEAQTPVTIKQSLCTVSWIAPQTSTDGTNLTDLKEYGVYVGTALNAMQSITVVVPAPAGDPATGATATWPCKTLPVGVNHFVQVDAVDTSGNRSARTAPFGPFVLQDDAPPAPPSALLVGP